MPGLAGGNKSFSSIRIFSLALINKRRDVAFEVSVIMRSINRNKILDQGENQQKCRTCPVRVVITILMY